mmetsp:Transcript_10918/g.20026  ORF Transcript_10918/g.20026 Transcript_10918/m.20026 type:complete len:749 (+) Transcript_10918:61-2307(+)|eukprot:CAMPEP_0197529446 /NCGR_PEP_ID=MMETSP1318-20131121/28417_1 /TAXON_ID=552666 /ORGANISM="Partenskyella glossopodia, Strain RCC365" /LENGTH=748 /DNA_ID=CAMNT_0043084909 /DNA_START=30 /DNA_END=2276 /DNA_ORIENTATION=+
MTTLSREILKWIQSLDLTYSVRNVRRDFANGFLVAEILSRFKEYSGEINMHSFDNGTAISRRKDNWQQLLKIFRKRSIPISEDLANAVLHCQVMAAIQMVEKLYTHLTKRSIAPIETLIDDTPAAYARPTASKVVKDKLKEPSLLLQEDQLTNTGFAQDAIDKHEMQLRQDRMNDRDRYTHTSKHRMQQRMLRVATRQVQHDDFKQPQIQFLKTVNVRAISDSVALRGARRGNMNTQSPELTPTNRSKESNIKANNEKSSPVQRVTDILNPILRQVLQEESGPTILDFIDSIQSRKPESVSRVFEAFLEEGAGKCAEVAMENPKQFWKLGGICCKALAAASEEGEEAVLEFVLRLAECCGQIDTEDAADLSQDYLVPKVVVLFKTMPNKRRALSDVVGAFCFSNGHVLSLLRTLKGDLDSPTLFECFAGLSSQMPSNFSDAIRDIYMFYVSAGLSSASKQTIHALTILANLCKQKPALALNMIEDLKRILEDPSWEIQAGVLYVMCSSLSSEEGKVEADVFTSVIDTILKDASPIVIKNSLYWMADCLPACSNIFMSTLKALPADIVAGIGPFPSGKALEIAQIVVNDVLESKVKNLEELHMQLLSASILKAKSFKGHSSEWCDVLNSLLRYILVEFLDAEKCGWASMVLEKFFEDEGTRDLACSLLLKKPENSEKAPKLFYFLKMFPAEPSERTKCQKTIESFLGTLVSKHDDLFRDIYNLLKNFESAEPERFESSSLKGLVEAMSR